MLAHYITYNPDAWLWEYLGSDKVKFRGVRCAGHERRQTDGFTIGDCMSNFIQVNKIIIHDSILNVDISSYLIISHGMEGGH